MVKTIDPTDACKFTQSQLKEFLDKTSEERGAILDGIVLQMQDINALLAMLSTVHAYFLPDMGEGEIERILDE